eukprot:TRINITY_DN2319_c0_g7_i1.p15 TRINITY_DN2319_c0_g7~~TRINITY_DN2319_c0_g7_i1.p15  ORF type:complete len:115 (+),score=1.49 TRINITY_DN2319_c0_g7_i1:520-864(+)
MEKNVNSKFVGIQKQKQIKVEINKVQKILKYFFTNNNVIGIFKKQDSLATNLYILIQSIIICMRLLYIHVCMRYLKNLTAEKIGFRSPIKAQNTKHTNIHPIIIQQQFRCEIAI